MSGVVVWITGLPSSGKTTLANQVHQRLAAQGANACVLDSDELRPALCPDLGFQARERAHFYEIVGNLAVLLSTQGLAVLVAATASERRFRDRVRDRACRFLEVYVDTPLAECMARDPKGLYQKARAGEISSLPGLDAEYQAPVAPELVAHGGCDTVAIEELVRLIQGTSEPGFATRERNHRGDC